jgi:hypothetical protein
MDKLKTINMYNYEQHFIDMVSNCCGDTMEEINEFCYACGNRSNNEIINNGTYCIVCKEENEVTEEIVCNSCEEICEPIEEYEYDQLRRDEIKEMQRD